MIADVPLGAFLSGGIDSSAVVAVMSELSRQPVHTFSITFGEKKFNEAVYARMIAKKYGTVHTEIPLSPKDFLEMLPAALNPEIPVSVWGVPPAMKFERGQNHCAVPSNVNTLPLAIPPSHDTGQYLGWFRIHSFRASFRPGNTETWLSTT